MGINEYSLATLHLAKGIECEFKIVNHLYLLGGVARGLTFFDQQVRGHNLAWALWRLLEGDGVPEDRTIAVIGGGIAGLTLTACLLARSPTLKVTLFEKRSDLCPLQQGSDTRWVHPHIYHWPKHGSRAPDAGLPVLNWTEGRASDVSREVLQGFGRYANNFGGKRLKLFLSLSHLRIDARDNSVEWMGRSGVLCGAYVRAGEACGSRKTFSAVVVATGFGLEDKMGGDVGANSYWRNDQLGQPQLAGDRRTYIVSGYGDGALVDLCRLTIERFRQDTILYELFAGTLEPFEDELRLLLNGDYGRTKRNVQQLFENDLSPVAKAWLDDACKLLARRLRKDTHIVLHASGKGNQNKSIGVLFDDHSSFLNRTLLYLLYRCGGFVLSLEPFSTAKHEFQVPDERSVVRHGTTADDAILALFSDPTQIKLRLMEMKKESLQIAQRRWPLGAFPSLAA